MQGNENNEDKVNKGHTPNSNSNKTNSKPLSSSKNNDMLSEKTRMVDISKISSTKTTGSLKTANIDISKTKAKIAAKVTLKSSLFVIRKVLTYALNIFLTALLVGIITGAVVGVAFLIYIKNYIDPEYNGLDNLEFDSSAATRIYYIDDDGNEKEIDSIHGAENRLWAEYNAIPQDLKDAYVAVEDQRYWEHNGVDTKRTLSAVYNFFMPSSSSYGGSTITQQLIKNVTGENEATIQRKVQEIFRALNVNEKFSKEQILEMYLNTIYLSQNSYGVRTAAQAYFGKELQDLTLVECASLSAIAKSPIAYDPILNPKNNLQRRNLVLKLMLEQEKITQEEFNEAYDAPLVLNRDSESDYSETIHSYYIDAVLDDVLNSLTKSKDIDETTASRMLYSGGLKIVTCVDPLVQNALEKVFTSKESLAESLSKAQAAMCVMDPNTGDLIGIIGGRGEKKISRGLNRATQSKRQCGSSIKPLSVYSLAIQTGLYTYGSSVDDVPVYLASTNKYWPPNCGTRGYSGKVPLNYAIKKSLNTVAVSTAQKLGVDNVYNHLENLGFTTLVDSKTLDNGVTYSDKNLSPLALGAFTYGVTVREMTQAYSVLANKGVFTEARTFSEVRNIKGNKIIDNTKDQRIIFSESTAYITTALLQNVVNPGGTAATDVKFNDKVKGLEVAGKTGTTNDKKDNYFCGYTPDYVACTWFGYDNNKTIVSRPNPATLLWDQVMNEIYTYKKDNNIEYTQKFTVPVDIIKNVSYCSCSGDIPTEACENDILCYLSKEKDSCICHDGVYKKGTEPKKKCDVHVMLPWDSVTEAICLDGCICPTENIINVGFRKITDRAFNQQIRIKDAQFVYRDVPEGYVFPDNEFVPFFQNILGSGVYIGSSGSGKPANRICYDHYIWNIPDNSDDISDDTSYEDFNFID